MNSALIQIILGARDTDTGSWMQLLVFIVMGILWVIGGILKARSNKIRESDLKEEAGEQGSKPGGTRQTIATQFATKAQRLKVKPSAIRHEPKQSPEPLGMAVKKAKPLDVKWEKAATTAPSEAKIEVLADFESSEDLRRAILHYEILGRPLSLRERETF